jgi:tRNA-Thr(GGU) m(6)t(6)A37 methyltransferase TsaA
MEINLQPIGIIHSPFKEKFAVPRQPGLAKSVEAELELLPPYNQLETLRGLEDFSHIWLIFLFHQNLNRNWHTTVRPPRLGGNKKVGVFASRSPFRPNPVGLSAVELVSISYRKPRLVLHLRGTDLVDGTPVLDIKPYLPYTDALTKARGAFASEVPVSIPVEFSAEAEKDLLALQPTHPRLRQVIIEILEQDPRPAYRVNNTDSNSYGVRIYNLNLKWEMIGETARVSAISPL